MVQRWQLLSILRHVLLLLLLHLLVALRCRPGILFFLFFHRCFNVRLLLRLCIILTATAAVILELHRRLPGDGFLGGLVLLWRVGLHLQNLTCISHLTRILLAQLLHLRLRLLKLATQRFHLQLSGRWSCSSGWWLGCAARSNPRGGCCGGSLLGWGAFAGCLLWRLGFRWWWRSLFGLWRLFCAGLAWLLLSSGRRRLFNVAAFGNCEVLGWWH